MGDKHMDLPAGLFGTGSPRRAIIDSGTTLAYLSSDIYEQVLNKVCLGTSRHINTVAFFVVLIMYIVSVHFNHSFNHAVSEYLSICICL